MAKAPAKKMPFKLFEKSKSDMAADKKGKHGGKEGSKSDMAADKKKAFVPFKKKR